MSTPSGGARDESSRTMRPPADWRTPWTGRVDEADGDAGRRWHQVVQPFDGEAPAPAGVCLVGLASDAGVRRNHGRAGAAAGPLAIRQQLAGLPVHQPFPLLDAGDVAVDGDALEVAQAAYAARVSRALDRGHLVIGLGGGHEIAWGTWCGVADSALATRDVPIGVLNLDAHFDLRRDVRATSGTPFRQLLDDAADRGLDVEYRALGISATANTGALYAEATARGVAWRHDDELTPASLAERREELAAWLATRAHVYLSLDLDVLPPWVAPGVSAPSSRGVPLELLEPLLATVVRSGRLRAADVAECNPAFDVDGRTARVAARLVWGIAQAAVLAALRRAHGAGTAT
jgi:formiminoglutamase